MKTSKRMDLIPPYLFAELDKKKALALAKGVDVINLGIGDPDMPTPDHIIKVMQKAVANPETHNYPPYEGTKSFREAVATFYKNRFNVELDPEKEVLSLIGSKEGLAHVHLAYVDPGDYVLVPDPAYPVYKVATCFADGKNFIMPLLEENNFLPDLSKIPDEVANKSKLMFLNYPNNPTGAVATLEFFEEAVHYAKKHDILICHDLAYSEMAYDNYKAPSFLEVPNSKDVCIEFNSLSKTYNMTGWRIGMAVGNAEAVQTLGRLKNNIDSGVFKAVQYAGIEALLGSQDNISKMNELYKKRRDIMTNGLNKLGWDIKPIQATFYMWIPVPEGSNSKDFSTLLLETCGIIVPPGIGYGEYGDKYFRIALTAPEERIRLALQRMEENNIKFK
ncbi:MAG: LL-diaminopimelate aminotransferase [Candidatus Sericytochromatia bacterium]|nr:LL-diaminopimelate aminotransferase [Candidatus Sericytochromatia bacterium]